MKPTVTSAAPGESGADVQPRPATTGAATPLPEVTPGSPEAIAAGCTCPRIDNGHGQGQGTPPRFVMSGGCPVHDDWATRTALAYVGDLRPTPHDVDGAVAALVTVLREVACDCFMASPIVRPDLGPYDDEGDEEDET